MQLKNCTKNCLKCHVVQVEPPSTSVPLGSFKKVRSVRPGV